MKEKPNNKYNIPGYKLECVNRVGREKGGVCMYISEKVRYKLRKDLCCANSNYESCFIEIENKNKKNAIIGVIYRAHTSIDNFVNDIDPVVQKINAEKKLFYIMGDFNIDLLKVDSNRAIHDYLELIYSYSLMPTIYKPNRITKTTATIIDNILTNNTENIIKSSIIVTDITDHMPTILLSDLDISETKPNIKKPIYKRVHSDDNIINFKKKLLKVKWHEILDNIDVNSDYNTFVETFNKLYDECFPLKKCSENRRKDPLSPWITKGLLTSINKKNKLYKQYINSPTNDRLQKFKTYKNKLYALIRKSKRKYFFNKFDKAKTI